MHFPPIFAYRAFLVFIITALYSVFSSAQAPDAAAPKRLHVAVYIDGGKHRHMIESLYAEFNEQNPDIKLSLAIHRGIQPYEDKVESWLRTGHGPDVVYWYGGKRIAQFAEQGKILDLQEFWDRNQLSKVINKASEQAVSFNGHVHAIPATTLLWSLYYNQGQLKEWGLQPPKNWQDMLSMCKTLRAKNITPIGFGSKTQWATHVWFDYLNMRINGLEFYKQLLEGQISYQDPRVHLALEHWKQLIDADCFNSNHPHLNIWEAFPKIVLGKTGFSLTEGQPQFVRLPENVVIDVAPFPEITPGIPQYTVHPTNVFMIPTYVEWSPELEKLLLFMTSVRFQQGFSNSLVRVPAHKNAAGKLSPLNKKVSKVVYNSPGGVQFLDRDSDIRFASKTPKIFVDFMQHLDIDKTTQELEQLRLSVFGPISSKTEVE
ncbi:ABC transporter substrate-binding protein [Agaribacterium sp. ZY112]|uniref:ABC transporter substrate-binding protein n=1 Tax=Agaribacterium sp. ZY112 TaxID=3233574 RepID=UPI003523DFCC